MTRRPKALVLMAVVVAVFAVALAGAPVAARAAPVPPKASTSLDQLYDRLAAASSDAEAEGLVGAIERARLRSGSDTVDLLMVRALAATGKQDLPLATRLLSSIIRLRPGFTEAWNKRATLYFLRGDYPRAMADIAQTLQRDPKHFGAWSGLGIILQQTGDKAHAYQAFQRALAIDPHLDAARKALDALKPEVEGRDI